VSLLGLPACDFIFHFVYFFLVHGAYLRFKGLNLILQRLQLLFCNSFLRNLRLHFILFMQNLRLSKLYLDLKNGFAPVFGQPFVPFDPILHFLQPVLARFPCLILLPFLAYLLDLRLDAVF
jgi:hypothetical protein